MTLTDEAIEALLAELKRSMPRPECRSCDCLQGLITQLELDAGRDISALTGPWKVPRAGMHGCLGCNPCPPGSLFAEYLKRRQSEGIEGGA